MQSKKSSCVISLILQECLDYNLKQIILKYLNLHIILKCFKMYNMTLSFWVILIILPFCSLLFIWKFKFLSTFLPQNKHFSFPAFMWLHLHMASHACFYAHINISCAIAWTNQGCLNMRSCLIHSQHLISIWIDMCNAVSFHLRSSWNRPITARLRASLCTACWCQSLLQVELYF